MFQEYSMYNNNILLLVSILSSIIYLYPSEQIFWYYFCSKFQAIKSNDFYK